VIRTPSGPSVAFNIRSSYFHLLAELVAVLAALGVLNAVLMATREASTTSACTRWSA
jgi:hypothetical protein